jgi:hypothetical protein
MKTFVLAVIVLAVVILRLNVPANDVGQTYQPQPSGDVVSDIAGRMLYSDAVADWQYRDYLLVKFACSERLKLKLIALPFGSWQEHRRDIASCAGF